MSAWEDIAAKKRQELSDSIPQEWRIPADKLPPDTQLDVTGFPEQSGWFTSEELEITNTPAAQLLEKLKARQWTSEKVTRAFCKRAAAAHQLVHFPGAPNQLANCFGALLFGKEVDLSLPRRTVSPKPSSASPSPPPALETSISRRPDSSSGPSTASPYPSRTTSTSSARMPPSASRRWSASPPPTTAPSSTCCSPPAPCCTSRPTCRPP